MKVHGLVVVASVACILLIVLIVVIQGPASSGSLLPEHFATPVP